MKPTDESMRDAADIVAWLHSDPYQSVQPRLAAKLDEIKERVRATRESPSGSDSTTTKGR